MTAASKSAPVRAGLVLAGLTILIPVLLLPALVVGGVIIARDRIAEGASVMVSAILAASIGIAAWHAGLGAWDDHRDKQRAAETRRFIQDTEREAQTSPDDELGLNFQICVEHLGAADADRCREWVDHGDVHKPPFRPTSEDLQVTPELAGP